MTQSPSSLTRTQALASSNSKSCNNSTRFWYSASFFKLRFLFLASQSGIGLAVSLPDMVYTGTSWGFVSFILAMAHFEVSEKFLEVLRR